MTTKQATPADIHLAERIFVCLGAHVEDIESVLVDLGRL